MQLHNLSIKNKKAKRVGRGGKRGTTCGRGTKGQTSRSGHRIRPAQRDLLIRIPKLRGYHNKPLKDVMIIINVGDLEKIGKDTINIEVLKSYLGRGFRKEIKILDKGEIKKAIKIDGIAVSKGAREKIEKAGGVITLRTSVDKAQIKKADNKSNPKNSKRKSA